MHSYFNAKTFRTAILAGVAVGIAGWGYLAYMHIYNGIIGAVLFSFGLLTVVGYKLPLYTGTAGFVALRDEEGRSCWMSAIGQVLFILLGNITGCLLVSLLSRLSPIDLGGAAQKILDVGAGSGCHALALQKMGKEVTAIDISELSVEVMRERGVEDARAVDLYDEHFVERYDTILLLMNGSGIIGNIEGMERFFLRMKQLLKPGGCIYMDSSDLKYLFEEEDGSYLIDVAGDYYGIVDFQMQYKQVKGDTFDWLYIDFDTLSYYAEQFGFTAEVVCMGDHYDYLAALKCKM